MKKKLIFSSISIISIIIILLIINYFVIPIKIPNDIDTINILDCRTNEEVVINDKTEIENVVNLLNETRKIKSNLKEMPNGATYKLTFIKEDKKECIMDIFEIDDYHLLRLSAKYKKDSSEKVNDGRVIINSIDELYEQ